MTVSIDLLGLIITFVIVVIAMFLVPMMLQLRTTTQRIDELVRDLQRDLVPLVRNLRQSSERLDELTETAQEGVARGANFLEAVGAVGDSIYGINALLGQVAGKSVSNAAGLTMGIKAAYKVFSDRMKKKGGE